MKNSILRLSVVLLSLNSMGQTINEMEYFFDEDPGYGMATSVTITPGNTINQMFNAPTGLPLTTGFHDLFLRVRETGGVLSFTTIGGSFDVGEVVSGGTSGATGTVLAAFSGRLEVSTTGTFTPAETLTGGTSGATGTLNTFTANWSVPESRLVYVDPTGAGTVLVEELEYFFDSDPGYGMGTVFPAFSAASMVEEMENVSTASLTVGFHTLFVRAKAVGGVWGIPESRLVFVDETGSGVILVEEVEYFFDTDPGYGMGAKFTSFTAANTINQVENLSTASLTAGFHTLFIRAKSVGNTWGVPESRLVYVDPTGAGLVEVEEVEYFFDTDPGYGMGTKFTAFTASSIINELESVSTAALSTGFHTLFVRAKSVGNTWGIPESRLMYADPSGNVNADIVAIEYFFDTDPGVGMATLVSVTTPGFNITEMFDVLASNVPLGQHILVVRAQNADGVWGMIETKSITSEIDNVLNFDGADDFVTVTDATSLDLTSTGTLAAWINPSSFSSEGECRRILAKGWGTGGQNENSPYQLMVCDSKMIQFSVGNDTDFQLLSSNHSILLNEWTHVAATWDGSDLSLYINGALAATATQTVVPFVNAEDLYLGSIDGTQFYWDGDMDEISIWSTSKTETEIQDMMQNELLGSESNLSAYYLFDEGTAGADNAGVDSLPDETANANDGALSNFTLDTSVSNWLDTGAGKEADIPGEPVDLFVTEVSSTQIDLGWVDRSFNETGFIIERSDDNNSSFAQIGTVGADVTTYSDNSVTAGNGYFYRVKATNSNGDSPATNEKFGSTIAQPGNALQFDGIDDFVDVGDIGLDFTTSPFTIEFWAKRDVIGTTGDWVINIGEEPSLAGESIHAGFVSGNQFSFDFKGDALTTDESFADTDWHHWAVLYDPDLIADSDDRKIYRDGVLLKSDDPASGFTGSSYLKIGQAFDTQFFGGIVDEVRVWDDVRTEGEITTFINSTLIGNEANLVAYYRLDQNEVTDIVVPDRSTNDYDGIWMDGGTGTTTPQWIASGGLSADLTAPTVLVQDISVSLDAAGMVTITTAQIDNGSTDDVSAFGGLVFSLDVSDFDCADIGANTVTLMVADEVGNTASSTATVTVVDDMLPTVVTQNFTITLDGSDQAIIGTGDIDNGTADNCGFTLSLDITTFTKAELGDNIVTLTATDAAGNSANATATVTVLDNNNPPTPVTQNITVSLDATGNVMISPDQINNGSSDDITADGDLALVLDLTSFDCANLGNNTVILTVTDEEGESATAPATVTVVDDMLPVVVAQDVSITLDEFDVASIATIDIDNGSTDNCALALDIDNTTFTRAELGDNTVTLTGTDESGNVSTATAVVTVLDNNAPPDIFYVFFLEENSAVDELIGTIVATDLEMDPVSYTILSGNTNDAFSIGSSSGNITVSSQEALDFETTPVFNLIVQADDGNGGIATVSITINLIDILVENPLGIGDELINMKVYPNPTRDVLYVDMPSALRDIKVKIFSMSGSLMLVPFRMQRDDQLQMVLDLEGLTPGIYLLKIQSEYELVTKNILVR